MSEFWNASAEWWRGMPKQQSTYRIDNAHELFNGAVLAHSTLKSLKLFNGDDAYWKNGRSEGWDHLVEISNQIIFSAQNNQLDKG